MCVCRKNDCYQSRTKINTKETRKHDNGGAVKTPPRPKGFHTPRRDPRLPLCLIFNDSIQDDDIIII